ncbi:hypothetical protein BC940DRAFT_291009 [Gongronella butleri]|nr:hypothetical protein BC940DRAFT_291009 [Gongronella butleri]
MGATISKAKQLSLPSMLKEHVEPSAAQSKMQISSTVRLRPRQKPRGKHHPHVASVSIKRRGKPKYKKVTKSIIGKPSNFKHTAHVGIDNMAATAASIDEVRHIF